MQGRAKLEALEAWNQVRVSRRRFDARNRKPRLLGSNSLRPAADSYTTGRGSRSMQGRAKMDALEAWNWVHMSKRRFGTPNSKL